MTDGGRLGSKDMWEKMRQAAADENGMTLAEIMVSFVIGSMIVVTAGGILIFSGVMTSQIGMRGNGKFLLDQVIQMTEEYLTYASQVQISIDASLPNAASYNHVLRFGNDGMVYLDGQNIYGETYYQKKRVTVRVKSSQKESDILSLELFLEEAGEERKILSYGTVSVQLANIGLFEDRKIRYVFPSGCDTMDSGENDIYIFYRLEE